MMTLGDDEKWFVKHDKLVSNGRDIMTLIQELSNHKDKGLNISKVSSRIRINLKNLENEVNNLKNETLFAANSKAISITDLHNRNGMIDGLTSRLKSLDNAFKTNLMAANECVNIHNDEEVYRRQLFNTSSYNYSDDPSIWDQPHSPIPNILPSSNPHANCSGHDYNRPGEHLAPFFDLHQDEEHIYDNDNFYHNDRQQLIKTAQKSQEENLDLLAGLISRQKHVALHISNEVTTQNDLIDDISINVDRTRQRIIKGTQDIRLVTRKHKTWPYWLIIVFLMVLIIIITLI